MAKRKKSAERSLEDKPLAAPGLISYRYRGRYGWIMIGAKDHEDALREAARSTDGPIDIGKLEVWDDASKRYVPARQSNPDRLTVTADDEEEAERKARKFGRVLHTKRIGPHKFVVSVSRRNNPDDGVTESELTRRLKF